ncbi:MAG TPA: preprotein translocase subunit SecE [Phycisphaerales bacterium]|nr:preprotein translocase subunit SecE [Phycisphaerales bacterium]
MDFGIYKPDQGYWTRMMTALGAGAMVASLALWANLQLTGVTFGTKRQDGTYALDPQYIQFSVAAVIIIAGAILVYWLVYHKPRTSEFLISAEGEMKKVNWSTPREIMGSTWVVMGISLLLVIALLVVDLAFSRFFHWIKVLQITG